MAYKWSNLESDTPHQIFDKEGYLGVVSLVLVNLSVALTPLLHFLCSRQMRQGLVIMLGGYISESDFKSSRGLRKRNLSRTSLKSKT